MSWKGDWKCPEYYIWYFRSEMWQNEGRGQINPPSPGLSQIPLPEQG